MSRRPGLTVLSSAVLLGFVLVGCSGGSGNDDGATDPASNTTSAAPTTSASASPDGYVPASADGPAQNVPEPTKPPLADEESVEGAQAFLDYLSDVRVYAWQTGDTTILRDITAPACDYCFEEYDAIDDLYADGGWATSTREQLTILDSELPVDEYGFQAPKAHLTLPGIQVWDSSGKKTQDESAVDSPQNTAILHLNHMDGAWEFVYATPSGG